MKIGFFLNKITSPLVLGFLFYGVISPFGIFFRLMGKNLLNLKNKNVAPHWIKKKPVGPPSDNMKNQF